MTMALAQSGSEFSELLASTPEEAPVCFELEPLNPGSRLLVMSGYSPYAEPVKELEIKSMVALGDDPKLAAYEYNELAFASLLIATYENAEPANRQLIPEIPSAMIRVTPDTPDIGLKTLNDLAAMTHLPGNSLAEVLRLIECNFPGMFDTAKTWDITTLGIAEKYQRDLRVGLKVTETILGALTQVVIAGHNKGYVDHCVSINELGSHKLFKRFGYPYHNLDPYDPAGFLYDTVGNGKGLVGVAGYVYVPELKDRLEMAGRAMDEDREMPAEFGRRCKPFFGRVQNQLIVPPSIL